MNVLGFITVFFYQTMENILQKMGFDELLSSLLKDLIIIRILEPASKLRSIELIEQYFGIQHRRTSFYKEAKSGQH